MKSSFLNIHDMVMVLTLVECLFLAVLLRVLPARRYQSRYLLSIFFLLVAGWVSATVLIWNQSLQTLFINHTVITPLLLSSCLLLQGPCLYFYLRSLTEEIDFRRARNLIHILPTLLAAVVILIFGISGADWLPISELSTYKKMAVNFSWGMVRISPLIYVFACFYVGYQLPRQFQQVYSSISTIELKLTYLILFGFFLHWLWAFIAYFAGAYLSVRANDLMGITEDFFIVLQVNGLFVLGLKNARGLLSLAQPEVIKSNEQVVDPSKIELVEQAIHEKKLYLENNINLERFAELAGLKPRDLSIVVNLHYQLNFFEFVNGLRVEEAKRMLLLPEYADTSILDIIYKSGFNSQSAFQRFFKRIVGCTPTEYRRKELQALGTELSK